MRLAIICFSMSGYEQMKKISAAIGGKARQHRNNIQDAQTGQWKEDKQPAKIGQVMAEAIAAEEYVKCRAVEENFDVPSIAESTEEWAARQFFEHKAILFIGATGIAVRAIASSVKCKLTDSPVLVMDDCGRFIIPLLSGHMGGANELALFLSNLTGAEPVITTATDRHQCFAVDLFARRNHLQIMNKEGIARVSSRALEGRRILFEIIDEGGAKTFLSIDPCDSTVREKVAFPLNQESGADSETTEKQSPNVLISSNPPEEGTSEKGKAEKETADSGLNQGKFFSDQPLWLKPKAYVLGIGCKRGKTKEQLEAAAEKAITAVGLDWGDIYAIASLDLKADEEGICRLAEEKGIPFLTYPAEILERAEGQFSESAFVRKTTGVGCVCERAAIVACGEGSKLILGKQAADGVTCALAERKWSINFDET